MAECADFLKLITLVSADVNLLVVDKNCFLQVVPVHICNGYALNLCSKNTAFPVGQGGFTFVWLRCYNDSAGQKVRAGAGF